MQAYALLTPRMCMCCTCKYTSTDLQHKAQGLRELALLVLTGNTNQ